jgi:nucleoside-diphosphate-sugar epimerase
MAAAEAGRLRILLTGAAGLLGGEIAGRLHARGHQVTGLVNRNPDIRSNDGEPVSIETVRGDITDPGFGLDESVRRDLAARIDLVIHCAAITDFTEENDSHRAVNLEGTRHVLAFADEAGAKLLHVSTAYVCGDRDGPILEDELLCGQGFTNGYEATKARAEALVRESAVPHVVARPAIVLGDHPEGRTRSFDTIYPILKVFAEGLVTRMPAHPAATLNLVPIDYVTSGIVELVERFDEARGRTFHLVANEPTPLSAFPETLGRFEGLARPQWVPPESFDPSDLSAMERRFFERGAAVYAGYFTRAPRFDDRNFRKLTGRQCPSTEDGWWERLVSFAIDEGFIRIRPPRKARA